MSITGGDLDDCFSCQAAQSIGVASRVSLPKDITDVLPESVAESAYDANDHIHDELTSVAANRGNERIEM